jgi:GDP-4-dehydro-6-deoxy-D-mannose reductase
MKTKTRVLVTGANGFIGRNLCRFIDKRYPDWQVYKVDRRGKGDNKFYRLDIQRENGLRRLLSKTRPRYIFHLAGLTSDLNFKDLFLAHAYSSFCLFRTIKYMKGYDPRVIIPSSAAEYGMISGERSATTEELGPAPSSLYGLSKMIQTDISLFFARQGLDVVIGRLFNVIGEGTPKSLSIGRFAYELARMKNKKRPRRLYAGNLDAKRDFLDIYDVCAYLTALAVNGRKGQVYNVCRGRSFSIRSLLYRMIKVSGLGDISVKEDAGYNSRRSRADSFGSARKIMGIAKIELTPLDKSLEATYEYYLRGA